MSTTEIFDASIHRGVAAGSCVMIEDDALVYAGPIQSAPEADGKVVLLHPDDFARFAGHLGVRRH